MRYPDGSIQLSESRDLPLVRQILRSEFLTHSQLFEFMSLNNYERSRKSFDWRLRRLADHGLVRRHISSSYTGEFVYSIPNSAASLLQGAGEYCLVGRDRFNGREAERSVLHSIGLNEIQLTALRAGVLIRWVCSREIRSQNELTGYGFAKDYDAVVTLRTASGEHRFALEYERSPKPMRYYRDVAASLDREAQVNHVLYLVSNYDLLQFVTGFFGNAQRHVFFGLVKEWHAHLLDMPVSSSSGAGGVPFKDALAKATALFAGSVS